MASEAPADDAPVVVAADFRACGLLQRTRWELARHRHRCPPPLPPGCSWLTAPPPAHDGDAPGVPVEWRYSTQRVVVLVDVRSSELRSGWIPRAIDAVLAALAAPPPPTCAIHVSVALSARASRQLRLVVHGWCLRRGDGEGSAASLARLIRAEFSRLADGTVAAAPSPPIGGLLGAGGWERRYDGGGGGGVGGGGGESSGGCGGHSLQSCIQQALTCLSLLPTHAHPAIVLVTDGVAAPIDAPPLALRRCARASTRVRPCVRGVQTGGRGRLGLRRWQCGVAGAMPPFS